MFDRRGMVTHAEGFRTNLSALLRKPDARMEPEGRDCVELRGVAEPWRTLSEDDFDALAPALVDAYELPFD